MTDEGGRVAGLLLAAGGGRRPGGRPKALLPHRGRLLVEHAAEALRAGGCASVHVVLGARAEEVRARVALPGCVLVDDPDREQGMGTSLRAGPARRRARTRGPRSSCWWTSRGSAPRRSPGCGARTGRRTRRPRPRTTAHAAIRCCPAAAHWAGTAATATGDRGARACLREHAAGVEPVECGDIAQPYDIDTEADLARLE
ncbi:Nicotine blue oxidoreductase [Streptomyces sp. enrichment culture]